MGASEGAAATGSEGGPKGQPADLRLTRIGLALKVAKPHREVTEDAPKRPPYPVGVSPDAIGEKFAARLQLLWTYVNEIGSVAQATSYTNLLSVLALFQDINERSLKEEGDEAAIGHVTISLGFSSKADQAIQEETRELSSAVFEEAHWKALIDRSTFHDAALRLLHETAVQQLVNAFEQLIGDVVRRHIFNNSESAAKDQQITYRELLEYSSLEEAQRKVVEKQVTDLLRNKDTSEQLKYLKDVFKVDLNSHLASLVRLHELVLRRHAIVHAGGVATSEYLRRVRKTASGGVLPSEGERLELEHDYINEAWDTVYAAGVILLHAVAREEAHRTRNTSMEEAVDQWMNSAAVWAIQQHRNRAAVTILQYAHKLRLSKQSVQLMVSVNYAQALKWSGDDEGCARVLNEQDWDAASSTFRFCVAVLRDQEMLDKEFASAVAEEGISMRELFEWPVFRAFRKRSDFRDITRRVLGADKPDEERFPASLLNFSHSKTVKDLAAYLEGVTKANKGAQATPSSKDVH